MLCEGVRACKVTLVEDIWMFDPIGGTLLLEEGDSTVPLEEGCSSRGFLFSLVISPRNSERVCERGPAFHTRPKEGSLGES